MIGLPMLDVPRYGARVERHWSDLSGLVTLVVNGTNGRVRIQRGREREVTIKLLAKADSITKLSETTETIQVQKARFELHQVDRFSPSQSSSGRYDSYSPPVIEATITVPRTASIRVQTYNSDIEMQGVGGPTFLKSYNGNIGYQAQSMTQNSISATTRNGKLSSEAPLVISPAPVVNIESYNGNVDIKKAAPNLKLDGGQFFDGTRFRRQDWYVVDGLLTKRAPSGPVQALDLSRKFIAPAYGDAHTHHFEGAYFSRLMVGKYLQEGTLYAQTMTEHTSMKADANTVVNNPDSLDVAYADAGFTATDGHPTFTYELLANPPPANLTPQQRSDRLKGSKTQEGNAYWIVDTPKELEEAWPKFLAGDPDLVKVFLVDTANREKNLHGMMGSFGLDPQMVPLITQKAHEAGLLVYAHVDTAQDFEVALRSGVDGLAHMPGYGFNEGSPDTVQLTPAQAELARGRYVQLTAGLAPNYADKNLPRTRLIQQENIRRLRHAGALPVIGSDSYGSTTKNEVAAWFTLKQTPLQVLTALCRDTPRSIFPLRPIGAIQEGDEANLVVLPHNPLINSSIILKPDRVIKQGRTVYLASREQR